MKFQKFAVSKVSVPSGVSVLFTVFGTLRSDMSNEIEGAIDIDFLEVLTLTIDIELTILESLTLPLTLRLVNDCMQLLTLTLTLRSQLLTLL